MSFCRECGTELEERYLENEGMIPYCKKCGAFRFKMFNTAISAIVYSPSGEEILLIQQYGKKNNILVAGYVSQGESAEHALVREIKEELGLEVTHYQFNCSEYYEKSNTLMINFACQVNDASLEGTNEEIDHAEWYSVEEVTKAIYHESLAEKFLLEWLRKANDEHKGNGNFFGRL